MAAVTEATPAATHAMSSGDLAYLNRRLANMDARDKEALELCLKAHPGLTPEEYMEMTIAYGF